MARVRPSASGKRIESVTTGSVGISTSMRRSNSPIPSPVRADTSTGAAAVLLRALLMMVFRSSRASWSILFSTRSLGRPSTPSSRKILSTSSSSSSWCGLETSLTCSIKAASCTSSRVARNAVSKPFGRSRINPTVSETRTRRFEGRRSARIVGSSVANILEETSTSARLRALNNVDLPAFV